MDSVAGVAAFALVVLVLGYLVPHRVRQKQQWAEARVEDRFSESLRVLAVAGPSEGQRDGVFRGDGASAASGTVRDIGPTVPRPVLERAAASATDISTRSREEGTDTVVTTRNEAGTTTLREGPPPVSRLALLERRAAAARRRLLLSVILLVLTVVVGVWAALAMIPWWAVAIPGLLLVLVLVLGRRAARVAQRSDAEWLARHRVSGVRGAGRAPRPAASPRRSAPIRVTGRAVYGSQTHTQMIPRVTPKDIERARGSAPQAGTGASRGDDGAEARAADSEPDRAPRSELAQAAPAATSASSAAGGAAEPGRRLAPWEVGPSLGRTWEPVPVPPPTYTLKAAAEQPESMPVKAAEAAPLVAQADARSAAGVGPTPVAGPVPTRPAGDELKPKTETLGLDLNEILARRRAAGQ